MLSETFRVVTLACEADGYRNSGESFPASIEIEFGDVVRDHVNVCTRLRIGDRRFEAWHIDYGIEVLAFADSLAALRDRMEGTARLSDWDGNTVLCLTVIDSGRGRIAVGGQLIPAFFWTEVASQDNLLSPRLLGGEGGIRIAFEGLVTDQSYLPSVIAAIRSFLVESKISVLSPMLE